MKLNNIEISNELINNYINHFGKKKTEIWDWEKRRKELHEILFSSVGIKRISDKGKKLSDAIDKHCIPLIEKVDYFVAGLKKISVSKNEGEMKSASLDLQNRQMYEQLQKDKEDMAKGLKKATSTGECRRCKKDLNKEGEGRVNDHLLAEGLDADPVSDPICMHCSEYDPDEHFAEFRKKYWSH